MMGLEEIIRINADATKYGGAALRQRELNCAEWRRRGVPCPEEDFTNVNLTTFSYNPKPYKFHPGLGEDPTNVPFLTKTG